MNRPFGGHRSLGGTIEASFVLEEGQDRDERVVKQGGSSRGSRNFFSWVYDQLLLDGAVQVVLMTALAIGLARLASLSLEREYDGSPLPGGPPEIVAKLRSLDEAAYLRRQVPLYQERAAEEASLTITQRQ